MTRRILIIDDSRTIRVLLRLALEGEGFEVDEAEDGQQGLQAFAERIPDAVITDINMPNMDGFGVIEAIRAGIDGRQVPILVLTTESAEVLRQRAKRAGATGWIVKPFEQKALVSALRRVIGAQT